MGQSFQISVHFQWRGAFLTPKVSWGSKKHISIKNVQEIENFAPAYLDDQTSYDFQTWIVFLSALIRIFAIAQVCHSVRNGTIKLE